MKQWFLLGMILSGFVVSGCANHVDLLTEISEVKVAMDRLYVAQQKEDMTALSALFAHDDDIVIFGFQEGERYVGWESVKGMFQMQMDTTEDMQTSLTDQKIQVSKDGKASWVSSLNHTKSRTGDQVVEVDYRSTVVLEKRDGKWLIVHIHVSQPEVREG